jgi:hypothetical protein
MLDNISDHRKDKTAYSKDDGYAISHNGNKTPRQTSQGWQLSVQWKDGTLGWIVSKDLKASNPIELAEYAFGNQLVEEPAFRGKGRSQDSKSDYFKGLVPVLEDHTRVWH